MKNRIKELREQQKMKQKELAEALGVRQNTLSTWETGRYEPDNEMLRRIAAFFGVSVDYIIGKSNYKELPGDQIDFTRINVLMKLVSQFTTEQFDRFVIMGENLLNENLSCGSEVKLNAFPELSDRFSQLDDADRRDIMAYMEFRLADKKYSVKKAAK